MKKYLGIFIVSAVMLITLAGCNVSKPTSINNVANTTSESDLTLIKQALATKSKWPIDQITVTVLQNTGDHARGGVVYQDDQGSGGGYWFAVKETDAWRIVLDGNGQISCSQMQKEGFPEAMIPDCCAECKPTQ